MALLALAGCAPQPGYGDEDDLGSGRARGSVRTGLPVTDVYWKADSVTVGGRRTAAPDSAHVTITPEGRVSGNYGCNHFSATARMTDDKITVTPGTATAMGCAKDVERFEKAMSGALSGRLTAAVADETLTLTTVKGDSIAFTSEPPAPLTGTTWTVGALVSGATVSSLPGGAERTARLTFGKDGSVAGSAGCNHLRGAATVSGPAITFGRINGTKMMCPGPRMKLERALLAILDGRTTYRIDHRTLTLTASNGKGFSATAPAPGK
ncbi:META domain-containing protein [Streptomyces sp. NPDC058231]|uniref:META domain-containing protein n=1 Tax=Streptomyces sp. NPDC058231 TaxID=3346392 RepID=UPI0036EC02DA